jgi:hypothetical protein
MLWQDSIAQVRSYLPHCSTNKMVNFRDPTTIVREDGARARPFLSKSEVNRVHLPDQAKRFWSLVDGIFMWAWLLLAFFAILMCQ